jgi:triosephosphate isomerase
MNGLRADGLGRANAILDHAKRTTLRCDVVLCPPASLLWPVGEALKGSPIALGAQDCHAEASGAHTGDLAAAMIAEAGGRYTIVGHSERRAGHAETDAAVAAKAKAARAAGLVPIICVGESQVERDGGRALEIVSRQVKESVPEDSTAVDTIIAYEPIWAIGTGRTPTTADIEDAHAAIRKAWGRGDGAQLRVLYGGSVKGSNASAILALAEVDGALVGGASLDAADFCRIIDACP